MLKKLLFVVVTFMLFIPILNGKQTVHFVAYAKVRNVSDSSIVTIKVYPSSDWKALVKTGAKVTSKFNAGQDTSKIFIDWQFERFIQAFNDSTGNPTTANRQDRTSEFTQKLNDFIKVMDIFE